MFIDEAGSDFEQAHDAFTKTFNLSAAAFVPTEKKFRWRHAAIGDSTMSLRRSTAFARLAGEGAPGNEIVIATHVSGQAFYGHGRNTVTAPLLTPHVMMNAYSPSEIIGVDTDAHLVHIDKRIVAVLAEEMDDARFLHFDVASLPVSQRALHTWFRTVNLATSVILDVPDGPSSLLKAEMSRLIGITMLTTFPFQSAARGSRPSGIEPFSLKLAQEFIEQNAYLPIGPADIAHAAGLSVRSLQHALRRYRDTTPTGLLQAVRLDRVREALLAGDPRTDSVSAIARQWGFLHLGRFSDTYQQRFGQLPSHTLRMMRRKATTKGRSSL